MVQVKKIKAEAFDIMQYFYSTVHDPLIHCHMHFSGHVDEVALKKAVTMSENTIPLLGCCFDVTESGPCWKAQGFTADDIVHVIEASSNTEEQEKKLLASTIDITCEPQIKIYIVRKKNSDALCVIINHMVCDGAGFKEYLYLLSNLYSQYKINWDYIPNMKSYSRRASQLLDTFSITRKLGILFSKFDLSKQKEQVAYCLEGDNNNPFFVVNNISKEDFLTIKYNAKKHGASVNDMILTAYARVLRKESGNDKIIIPCPVDLRKYLPPNNNHGICNFTSNFICDVTISENELFEDTLIKISNQMKLQKSSTNCLKAVMMLEFILNALPFHIVQKMFSKIFTIPLISFTNLGVINKDLLRFGDVEIIDAYITGAIKHIPYFQVAVSTYDDTCTLSCNLHGTQHDKERIEYFLMEMKKELSF